MPIKAQCTLAGFADRVSLSFRRELIHVDMGLTEASPGLELGRLMQTAVVCLLVAVIYKLLTVLLQLRDAAGKPPIFPGPDGHWLMGHAFMVRHRNAFNSGKTERFQATENIFVCVCFFQVQQDESGMEQLIKWGRQYPYAFTIRLGPVKFLYIHHPDYAKTFLTSSGVYLDFYQHFK